MPGHSSAMTGRNVLLHREGEATIVYEASEEVGDRTHLLIQVLEGDIYCTKDVASCYRYRVSNSESNYISNITRENKKAKEYAMICKLESWALQNRGVNLHLDKIKKDRFIGSIVIWMKCPGRRNFQTVCKIIGYSGHRLSYIFLAIKTIVVKLFCWHVLKEDRLIEI